MGGGATVVAAYTATTAQQGMSLRIKAVSSFRERACAAFEGDTW
jgi:hypothetical protein